MDTINFCLRYLSLKVQSIFSEVTILHLILRLFLSFICSLCGHLFLHSSLSPQYAFGMDRSDRLSALEFFDMQKLIPALATL
jgi:hypothetical protein